MRCFIMKFHCFFEQSGTFKNVFKKLGFESYDYDLLNDFGETDFIIDLFSEIEKSYSGLNSVFDTISNNDLIFAFFPCVRFSVRMGFNFLRHSTGKYKYSDIEKLEQNIRYFNEINYYYGLISKLVIVCLRKGLKLIIENPYHARHVLTQFWHLKPKIIDMNRTRRGDSFKKPTQYWFINCEPKLNFVAEPYFIGGGKTIAGTTDKVARSLISPYYAERFIKEFIL